MMALIPRSIIATVWISLLVGAGLLYGHDEDKGTRIAAGLQASPAEYEPHNVDLVGRIALGADLEIPRPVRMPPGNLLTAVSLRRRQLRLHRLLGRGDARGGHL